MDHTTPVHAVIHEVDLTMRLLKGLLSEFHRLEQEEHGSLERLGPLVRALESRPSLDDVPHMLFNAHREIVQALSGLRKSREAIQGHAIARLRETNTKLNEVTSATENAADAMLDSLDRTLAVINALECPGSQDDAGSSPPLRDSVETLRREIDNLFHCLQFQDITTQQINGAAASLEDVENRLGTLAQFFDPERVGPVVLLDQDRTLGDGSYCPNATFENATERQDVADQVLDAHETGLLKGKSIRTEP